ncbi:MAG: SRPBCC domain-containing protein [Albidovulum sp.]
MTVETSKTPNDGLRLTRRFDAAPERVFAAWLDPGAVKQWLFAAPSDHPVEIDAQPGGSRLLIPNRWGGVEAVIAYLEIAPPRRLVFDLTLPYF